ncbi:MAG: hypothetical protein GTO63_13710, partial [Anaerolineae bacterium]|nr:hypothetical protein [Anaerolineae bacterium]
MKLRALVFVVPVLALLVGLGPVVFAQGGDEMLCPRRIFLPIVMIDSSGVIHPPLPILPVVISLDGPSVETGSDLRVKLDYHRPAERYDVYVYNPTLGYVVMCTNLETDVFGSVPQATCHVPATTARGCYQLVTIQAGGETDPANHVAEGDLIDVLSPVAPVLVIQESNRWPPGSSITFQLLGHNPCPPGHFPCPPYQEYDI